mmetsp:Transcript_16542/g.24882  ORF Transcript_16542/g.24882 Transcript_16542/m.24882 type:complete len:616 (+) Transcript_16542:55-1902(+)
MVKIIEKIQQYESEGTSNPYFSFEYFPPKTEAGVENLYLRMDRMTAMQPIFVDITWGAGASTKSLTMAIAEYAQKYFGVEVLMHLTCTGQTQNQIRETLKQAKEMGIHNILALRGDPPKGALTWTPCKDGFDRAVDLVRFIKQEFGDYFGVAVAAFPEGYPQVPLSVDEQIAYLKDKVDAGADFVLTQFFYDTSVFISFVEKCRAAGISCPIIPGMMPIQNYSSFQRMTSFCRTAVPQRVWEAIAPISDNDEAVKAFGVDLCVSMCNDLQAHGVRGFHFYTLNLEHSVLSVLRSLHADDSLTTRRGLPWRGSRSNLRGMNEDVRPINWANRPKSYIARTMEWDEFPNGRWGDSRSPAFGELSNSHFFGTTVCTKEDRLAMWGEAPLTDEELGDVFAKYIEGKIPILPWCESALQVETGTIAPFLLEINRKGFFTINSQPSVNGARSDHSVYGWGGPGGRVYQKSYVEFFTRPSYVDLLMEAIQDFPSLTLHAINCNGESRSHASSSGSSKGVTALTWGVFPDKEILQPTIFDPHTFGVWSKEAFQLWLEAWAVLYDDETESCAFIHDVHDTYYLVAIIDNEYIDSDMYAIFRRVLSMIKSTSDEDVLDDSSGLVV